MSRFKISDTPINGLKVIQRSALADSRGRLYRLYCSTELSSAGWLKPIAQINCTHTLKRGTVRGMHFQHAPHSEMKLVMCLRGAIWDVAVDLRTDSPTRLHWHAVELSESNNLALLLPEAFAHGFQTLTNDVELLYLHSEAYKLEAEDGLNPKDPKLSISWPLPIEEMSAKDAGRPMYAERARSIDP